MSCASTLIRVPASTSNLGPGFDCFGLALNLYNVVRVTRSNEARAHRGMVAETVAAFHRSFGTGAEVDIRIEGDIPVSRGLGSSVSVRLGILLGLTELAGANDSIPRGDLLRLLIELEGHPDNAVASFLGGFAICAPASPDPADGFGYTRVAVAPGLSFVTLIPDLKLSTEMARGLLPAEIPFRSAVENVQRAARISALFCTGDYAALRGLFFDHLHQPFRQTLIPGFASILAAAREAGALGSFLSGAGSSLMALTLEKADAVAAAMSETAKQHGLPARTLVLQADNDGAQVLERNES